MVRPFIEVFIKADPIYGSFTKNEMWAFYFHLTSITPPANIVEIGSYCGRSSSVLGMIANDRGDDLTCVDYFVDGSPTTTDVKAEFIKNMASVEAKYELLYMKSIEAAPLYKRPIDLLFIDGDHLHSGVKSDVELWLPKVKKGGFVLFHDYWSSWDGVKKAVDEFAGIKFNYLDRYDSLYAAQKI